MRNRKADGQAEKGVLARKFVVHDGNKAFFGERNLL